MTIVSIALTDKELQWIKSQPRNFNFSAWVRDKIEIELMQNETK